MTTLHAGASTAPTYIHAADLEALQPRFEALVGEILVHSFSAEKLGMALEGGICEAATILRAIPIQEGRLIERGIGLIAALNPDLLVLTDNLRLPVTKAALELVEKNDPKHYRSLTLDANGGSRKSYTPDLIILNGRTKLAHVVDVKRSLGSYEVSRITELKQRMLAAALVVPDLLYRDHHRLVAEEVRVVILNAENQRADIAGGVWPLAHLDHLLEVDGAGAAIGTLQSLFQNRIDANWRQARHSVAAVAEQIAADGSAVRRNVVQQGTGQEAVALGSAPTGDVAQRSPLRIGFARVPKAGTG